MTIDLTTQFGNLNLKSPIVVGACPMTAHELTRIALMSSGAGAIVLPSLFDEQVKLWSLHHGLAPALNRKQDEQQLTRAKTLKVESEFDAESYLDLVRRRAGQIRFLLSPASMAVAAVSGWTLRCSCSPPVRQPLS